MTTVNWLLAWWYQLTRRAPFDPWSHDPEIVRERARQHNEGVVDAFQRQQWREADFWRRYAQRRRDA